MWGDITNPFLTFNDVKGLKIYCSLQHCMSTAPKKPKLEYIFSMVISRAFTRLCFNQFLWKTHRNCWTVEWLCVILTVSFFCYLASINISLNILRSEEQTHFSQLFRHIQSWKITTFFLLQHCDYCWRKCIQNYNDSRLSSLYSLNVPGRQFEDSNSQYEVAWWSPVRIMVCNWRWYIPMR